MNTLTNPQWRNVRLGDIGQSLIGLTYSPSDVKRSGTLVLRSSNIQDGELAFNDNVYVDCAIPEKIRTRENDILICVRNGSRRLIGKSAILDHRVSGQTFGAFMAVYRSDLNPFLRYFFQSDDFKRQIDEHLGATINQITNGSLNGFVVTLPSESEQQAIAERLQDVDRLIATLKRLISKKHAIKQGMMQELLTGRTRLQGFSKSWQATTFGGLVRIQRGSVLTRAQAGSGRIPVIAGGKTPAGYTDKANRVGRTITISASGASAGYVALYNEPIFASDCSTISSSRHYDLDFIYYSLLLRQDDIYRAQTGGAQPHIHACDVYPMEIRVPTDMQEQIAIAQVLVDADKEIMALERLLESVRGIKQGMMQELLTGRTKLVPEGV